MNAEQQLGKLLALAKTLGYRWRLTSGGIELLRADGTVVISAKHPPHLTEREVHEFHRRALGDPMPSSDEVHR